MSAPSQLLDHLAHTHVDLTYWINNAKANKAGEVPVSLRITVHGTRAEASTGIRCLPERWNKATHRLIPKDRKDAATLKLNDFLAEFEASARVLGGSLKPLPGKAAITAPQVRDALLPQKPAPTPCALALFHKASKGRANPNSRAADGTALRALARFLGEPPAKGPHLPATAVTPALATDFVAWLVSIGRSKACENYLRRLSGLYTLARLPEPNPFTGTHAPRAAVSVARRYVLSKDEIAQLEAFTPAPGMRTWARDIYLCQYYLHGSRLGPVLELTWEQVDWKAGRVFFVAEKRGRLHNVQLRAKLAAVLQQYAPRPAGRVFPVLPAAYERLDEEARFKARKSATASIWKALKRIGEQLGFAGKLHSHTARHSLATHTVEATGSIRAAQAMLDHKSESTTERYVRSMLPAQLDAVADSVYD